MRRGSSSIANLFLLLVLVGGLLPACSSSGDTTSPRDQENALLLQISSHVRLSGEPDLRSYVLKVPSAYKIAYTPPALAPTTTTEIDIYTDLFTTYMSRLHAQGNLTDSNVNRIVNQLDAKIKNLNKRSQQLEKRRRRRGRGLARFFRRVGQGIGRFVRQLGRGIGKAAEYLIEDVAPEVIRDMVLTGQPLTAKIFWKGVRKVVRSRLKRTVGTHLARRGVPPEILAEAGLDLELEKEQEPVTEDQPTSPEIGYGNYKVEINDPEGNFGYFSWKAYWTNLPENGIDRCQWLSSPTADVDAYLDEYPLTLEFELDAGQLKGSTDGDGVFEIAYEMTDWVYGGLIEEGWVRPSTDATGWSFGGTVVFDINIHDQWRCFECVPTEGGCADMLVYWLEDEKSTVVNAKLEGWTEQVVPGEGDEPDRLEPGGTYTFNVEYEDANAELLLGCDDCVLPSDFPPPVYQEE